MKREAREALTLAISANAAAVAARAAAGIIPPDVRGIKRLEYVWRADDRAFAADRYWLRLANTLRRT
jgi:hypothetical protein